MLGGEPLVSQLDTGIESKKVDMRVKCGANTKYYITKEERDERKSNARHGKSVQGPKLGSSEPIKVAVIGNEVDPVASCVPGWSFDKSSAQTDPFSSGVENNPSELTTVTCALELDDFVLQIPLVIRVYEYTLEINLIQNMKSE